MKVTVMILSLLLISGCVGGCHNGCDISWQGPGIPKNQISTCEKDPYHPLCIEAR